MQVAKTFRRRWRINFVKKTTTTQKQKKVSERKRQADDCEWESVCWAKQESDQSQVLIVSFVKKKKQKQKTNLHAERELYSLFSLCSHFVLFPRRQEQNNVAWDHSKPLLPSKQIHVKIIGGQMLIISANVDSHPSLLITLHQRSFFLFFFFSFHPKPRGECAFTF